MAKKRPAPDEVSLPTSVRKAAEAIAITPKSGRLTLLTRKLYNAQLIAAQEQGQDRDVYRVSLSELVANAAFDSNDTQMVKNHLRRMVQTQVEWNSVGDDEERRWGVSSLLAEAELVEEKRGGRVFIEWSYPPKIKRRLLDPAIYARISLQFMNKLRSGQAFSLYEICARYADAPGQLTMRRPWEWWRPVLTGFPEGSIELKAHSEYRYFNRDVVKPAVVEVNTLTDLNVEQIVHKNGRRVEDLQFRVTRKAQAALAFGEQPLFDMALLGQLMALGASQADAEQVYAETEEATLRAVLKEVAKRRANAKLPPLTSPWAYCKALLKSGTVKPPEPPRIAEKPKETHEQLLARYMDAKRAEARAAFGEMREPEQDEWIGRYRGSLLATKDGTGKVLLDELEKKGLKSKRVEVGFFTWFTEEAWGVPTEKDLLEFVLQAPQ